MAIFHDIYECDISGLVTALEARFVHIKKLDEAMYKLQADVLDYVSAKEVVQLLSSRYGGYDVNEIKQQFKSVSDTLVGDIGFLLTLLVFEKINTDSQSGTGLGTYFESVEAALLDIGWAELDAKSLIYGRSFIDLFSTQNIALYEGHLGDYWKHIKPNSTSSTMGWLGASDLENLILWLSSDTPRILASQQILSENTEKITTLLHQVTQLLEQARQNKHG
ncbi:MAG: hypothetical protein K8L99_32470, partial [Anaerolineae bacterium]|nr:hypothetical protein [Anaerolineae bacterium]